ncbi:MAG: DUF934 domain-containing protein [Sandaracinaceae bacterium]|nr:DUF934 domain-containing protein [Sandaracinaceae bacterium]
MGDARRRRGAAPEGDVVVTLARLRRDRDRLRGRRIGVRAPGDTDPEELARHLDGVELVVVELPKFTDGRAYTLARLLRTRFGYAGELRATGDVLRDQLFYLARCGFTSFELAPGRDVADALRAFEDFSVTYQPAADHDEPIWRRRASS